VTERLVDNIPATKKSLTGLAHAQNIQQKEQKV